jgi:hypothetical protein
LRALQEHLIGLYAAGRRVVILIDEAHVMPDETLEQVRLLSNLESNRHKLLQIVLFGQPELDTMLAKANLRQLRDRITHSFRMRPLAEPEVGKYISFRMRAAGYRGPEVFSAHAVTLITRAASGLTRRINILADKSLLSAFTENSHAVADRQVRAAIADSEFASVGKSRRPALFVAAALAAGVVAGAAIQWSLMSHPLSPEPGPASDATPVPWPVAAAPTAPTPPPQSAPPAPLQAEAEAPAPPAPPPLLRPEQQRRLDGYRPAGQRLLSERIAASRELLDRAPDERYSVELFTTENADPARMERFLLRARDLVPLQSLFVIPMSTGGSYRLRVLYGEFETRQEALEAERRLPPRYQEAFRASPRSLAEVRSQI